MRKNKDQFKPNTRHGSEIFENSLHFLGAKHLPTISLSLRTYLCSYVCRYVCMSNMTISSLNAILREV